MRTRSRGVLAPLAALVLTLTFAFGPMAQAQSPSPGPSAPAASTAPDLFCGLLTTEEIGEVLGFVVTVGSGTAFDCQWLSAEVPGSLHASVRSGTAADIKVSLPGGTDLMVGEGAAYYLPGTLWVEVSGRTLEINDGFESGVTDQQAALSTLAAIAAARFESLSIPEVTVSSPEPQPSLLADVELKDLFPADLRGPFDEPLDVTMIIGLEALQDFTGDDAATRKTFDQLVAALMAQGKTIDDLSIGYATLSDVFTGLLAVRVRGADAAALEPQAVRYLVASFLNDPAGIVKFGKPRQAPAKVGGKAVTMLTPAKKSRDAGQAYAYVYTHDDVVWFVIGAGDGRGAVPKAAIRKLP